MFCECEHGNASHLPVILCPLDPQLPLPPPKDHLGSLESHADPLVASEELSAH
jgi:hypothetical protein